MILVVECRSSVRVRTSNLRSLCIIKYLTARETRPILSAMTSGRPVPAPRPTETPALHVRAMDNLAFIRETMERAGAFTAVSGWGMVAVGVVAAGATGLAAGRPVGPTWLSIWLGAALVSVAVSGWAIARKASAAKMPLLSGPGRKFAMSFTPAIVVGAMMTAVLVRAGLGELLPGLWLMLYGTGVIAGGAFSVRIVPVMGVCFLVAGIAAAMMPFAYSSLLHGLAFSGLHILFGILIARSHGG